MNDAQFSEIWNSSASLGEIAELTGCKKQVAAVRASRLRKKGNLLKLLPTVHPIDIEIRFFNLIHFTDGCWFWMGSDNEKGYGQISTTRKGGPVLAHRLSWELHYGPIPTDLLVLHKCDNPKCVNPENLFIGTPKINTEDMMKKERGHWQRNAPRRQVQRELAEL